jgi:hypothetical protein
MPDLWDDFEAFKVDDENIEEFCDYWAISKEEAQEMFKHCNKP